MSWIERAQRDLVIKTGDGKEYRPLWRGARKQKEYNVTEFEFENISGALVKRERPKANKYEFEIYFTGENHLENADAFELSADDSRPWELNHPYYGEILVQPTSLSRDNRDGNVSAYTGVLIETLGRSYPRTTVEPQRQIEQDVNAANESYAQSYAEEVTPTVSDINEMSANLQVANTDSSGFNTQAYQNAFNTAQSKITNATSEPLQAMREMINFLNAPAKFQTDVQTRFDLLEDTFNTLTSTIGGTFNSFKLYESNGAGLITGMSLALSTPLATDYRNRDAVFDIAESLINVYDTYITTLDSVQAEDGGAPNSFISDPNGLRALSALVNFTVSNLFNIASDARQQRSVVLEQTTNWILLTHRFYPIGDFDTNFEELLDQNNVNLENLIQIPANTRIVYYT